MVLAESYYAETPEGRREWINPGRRARRRATPRAGSSSAQDARRAARWCYDGIGTMSKSKNNGVDPQALIDKYGADTARFYIIFASPPTNTLEWTRRERRGLVPVPEARVELLRRSSTSRPAMAAAGLAKATRFEIHSVLKQANYDLAEAPVQYRRLRRDEDPERARARLPAATRIARHRRKACRSCCALLSPDHAAHLPPPVARARLRRGRDARALARARPGGARAGRDRVRGAGQRQDARQR